MNGYVVVFLSLAVSYAWGAYRLSRHGIGWPRWRVISFCSAAVAVAMVLSPPLMAWGHHDFRGHMVMHLIVGMIAPIGLVMAAPVTLALKNMPAKWGRAWVNLVSTVPIRFLAHPVTAAILNVGGMAALYLTDLYAMMLRSPIFASLLHWHFVIAGCLFTWAIAGPDPAPRRPSLGLRFGVLVASMAAHATVAKWMVRFHLPTALPPGMVEHGAQLMFYAGEIPEALLAFVLIRQWLRRADGRRSYVSSPVASG
ncbi:cytochrome c oxidase assembly protein [Salinicola rhizosphaerae]|uniref:Cytochrome c oxidase assembly protein n=1 Tax=Salinicola rhizosphaerae TaxID=1443141 RepID=A0ABQ3ED32_9GAMM|nr:cytochrome c oxidase assembly protein [Salinicola rhizosphaerae]GHB34169.1 hypothetical protein GCM10009038_36540 [Salinicola rhizosphaerae]